MLTTIKALALAVSAASITTAPFTTAAPDPFTQTDPHPAAYTPEAETYAPVASRGADMIALDTDTPVPFFDFASDAVLMAPVSDADGVSIGHISEILVDDEGMVSGVVVIVAPDAPVILQAVPLPLSAVSLTHPDGHETAMRATLKARDLARADLPNAYQES